MISKRLLQIADLVEENKAVFDVGSDHALLPCFLVEKGICPKAYAGEIAEGPLESGKQNIIRHGLEGKVIPVLSDGLDNAPDDVEIVIIAVRFERGSRISNERRLRGLRRSSHER